MNGEKKNLFLGFYKSASTKKRAVGYPSHTVLMIKTDSVTYETRGLSI